jgi:XTP/dITP diphosphohydrolase
MKKIHFVTSNKGKMLEAKTLLSPLGYDVVSLEIPYPEIQASDLKDVALFGIKWLIEEKEMEDVVMLEDAGLFIHTLQGFPGVFSAYIFETIGPSGILRLMSGTEDRSAHFESCIAYCKKDSESKLFSGSVHGMISLEPFGSHGFGYDPIFIPKGETRTFAQMNTKEKNQFSHRARALKKLADYLSK